MGPEALIQWVHLRLHQVPVIWIQSVVRRRKGAVGAVAASTSGVSAGLARRSAHELGAQSQPATDQLVERNSSCSPSQQEEQDRAPDKVLVPGLRVDEQLDGHDLPEEG